MRHFRVGMSAAWTHRYIRSDSSDTSHNSATTTDSIDALFDEMERCDTSNHSEGRHTSQKSAATKVPDAAHTPLVVKGAKLKLEIAKNLRLQHQVDEAKEELKTLLTEKKKEATRALQREYLPSASAKSFLSSTELIQEKSPQHFTADEMGREMLQQLPHLQHSGCAAVVTMVGSVISVPNPAKVLLPNVEIPEPVCDFVVKYDIPFLPEPKSLNVLVRAMGATLSAFAKEHVAQGDVVHILGHLAPHPLLGEESTSCAVYVLPAGGNISVVLSKQKK